MSEKKTLYFSHDFSARNDIKMTRLSSIRSEAGSKGARVTNARRASPSNTPVGKPTAIADLLPQQIPGTCRSGTRPNGELLCSHRMDEKGR